MSRADKLDEYKKEIRSILIPYQKGVYLSEFNKAYSELIGKRLPSQEMGFRTDIDFLYSLPDVVYITPFGNNQYHLQAVPDEKSIHIQKMVARQKPAKLKLPTLHRFSKPRSYLLPPRFNEKKYVPEPIHSQKVHSTEYEKKYVPEPIHSQKVHTTEYEKKYVPEPILSQKVHSTKYEVQVLPKEKPKLPPKSSPKEEVISLIQHFDNNLAVDDIVCEYKRMYSKDLSLSRYGFSSIEECIKEIPELEMVYRNNVTFAKYRSEVPVTQYDEQKHVMEEKNKSSLLKEEQSALNSSSEGAVPKSLREKLQKVADKLSNGILASEFPNYFKLVTGHSLELDDLGFRSLNDLVDAIPDIFIRKPFVGSKKDYIIYSANGYDLRQNDNDTSLKHIILNLRKILEAYPEGIKLQEISHIYSINFKDSLQIKDFGFDNIEMFLLNVKSHVPLRFSSNNGEKSVHLQKISDYPGDSHLAAPEAYDKEAIPYDAIFPQFLYKPQTFSSDFDFSKYIPAYTSSVAHAGHLYLQLQGDAAQADDFIKLGTDLDNFYNGPQSNEYMMKPIHIEVGSSCVAKWPADQHWYRAQIMSIPSMQNVNVHYVDYGTRDEIPKFLLRYAKKEFTDLPGQAIRCRLAFLKPPRNAPKWSIETRNPILKLCEDKPLMAKIEEKGSDGIYSVLLCDTNGEEDVFINDVLQNEGLADYDTPDSNQGVLPSPEPKLIPEPQYYLNPLQALQAQYYLQAFAYAAPPFAQNENYLKLLKQVALYCQNSSLLAQNCNEPFAPPVVPPGFNISQQGMNALANPNALFNAHSSTAPAFGMTSTKKPKANAPVINIDFSPSLGESDSSALPILPEVVHEGNAEADNEIFDDDDDEMFQQFCQTVSSANTRHVKRVLLGDGYKIHVIVVGTEPYASSGDISQLIWNNKEADYLVRRLQLKDVEIPAVSLSEDGNTELFQQLLKFNVKGVQKTTGFKSSILLYPLKIVIKILNIFGHPSVTLRKRLTDEIINFNLNDPHWNEVSPDTSESESEENFYGVTDDDKIERLCLFDLYAMKESIMCKKKKMFPDSNKVRDTDEYIKLERLLQKVLQRIQEMKEICKEFA